MLRNIDVTYGNVTTPMSCRLCGNLHDRFGTLIDPNGHRWLLCSECIDALWAKQQFVIRDEEVDRRARQLLEERLLGRAEDV